MPDLDLFTAGNIARHLKVPDVKVKNAIKALKLKPTAKKGPCCYYGADAIAKIKKAVVEA